MLLTMDISTYLFNLPEAPEWLPMIAIPCVIVGIIAVLASLCIERKDM